MSRSSWSGPLPSSGEGLGPAQVPQPQRLTAPHLASKTVPGRKQPPCLHCEARVPRELAQKGV